MSRIIDFAVYCTTGQKATYTSLNGTGRHNVAKDFYKSHNLDLPVSITITTTKKGSYLTKNEIILIQSEYIEALRSGAVSEELENNFKATTSPDLSVTFSETLPYKEALKEFGPAIVAAKMIDSLPVELNEEFHKIRKFDVPADIDIKEIPAFIKALQEIYDKSQK